ncbi:hypothetical protein GCM10022222_64000 [Amycolatopsis ultiminotia]|uniref:Uncharacterized protein n=1 Tax=Amycolatopsis ultiminotia TaxID=543629 RepID=A0ABP6XSM9_9PSEU
MPQHVLGYRAVVYQQDRQQMSHPAARQLHRTAVVAGDTHRTYHMELQFPPKLYGGPSPLACLPLDAVSGENPAIRS